MPAALPVYKGPFGAQQAERLLWRAGFGPGPGDVERLQKLGMRRAVESLTRAKGPAKLRGPKPTDDKGRRLAPRDAWGHGHLFWLDRMVRTNQPLEERMTLIWHDWFATSLEGSGPRWMLKQYYMLRANAFADFKTLVHEVTKDPAMLIWLSGVENNRWSPNENYARELMELFTLGAGRGYNEADVRNQARALSGFRNDWNNVGATNFRFDREFHDPGVKRIFGKRGRFDWKDACNMCLRHPKHASFMVTKLWGYFIPTAPTASDVKALCRLYRKRKFATRPLVEAILMHPQFYNGPRMVKPPVVQAAGLLRHLGMGVKSEDWSWLCAGAGQQLFLPPNVSGWDDDHWLDTSTWRGRWSVMEYGIRERSLDMDNDSMVESYPDESPNEAVEKALRFWGQPTVTDQTREELVAFAREVERRTTEDWQRQPFKVMRQNALRALIANSPDMQTC